ncbi:MAG: mechanosensitive ion channel family protein [Treponema sp.]
MQEIFERLKNAIANFLESTHTLYPIIVLAIAVLVHRLVRRILIIITNRIKTSEISSHLKIQQYIFNKVKFERLSLFVYVFAFILLRNKLLEQGFIYAGELFAMLSSLNIIYIVTRLLHEILDGFAAYTENTDAFRGRSYRSYIQVFILLVYLSAVVIVAGVISGKSPWDLLSGISAMTAVLLLVFRETILSFVSSLQISSYDLVRLGDWISVPKYDTDGDVIELSLHTIKIRNWDKTISVVPTNELLQSGFKNWRGMTEIGGRRIKRSIFLNAHSIKFMDKPLRDRLGNIEILKPYFEDIEKDIGEHYVDDIYTLNGRRLTNIGTFRIYVLRYLQSLSTVRQDLTLLVRQLESGPTGIPLELYLFTSTTEWAEYEIIQANIFDHLFAILPTFDLEIFQYQNKVYY